MIPDAMSNLYIPTGFYIHLLGEGCLRLPEQHQAKPPEKETKAQVLVLLACCPSEQAQLSGIMLSIQRHCQSQLHEKIASAVRNLCAPIPCRQAFPNHCQLEDARSPKSENTIENVGKQWQTDLQLIDANRCE